MFQSFETTANPKDGPDRLARLRIALAKADLKGFVVPRADAHQGEYVAPRDDRLAWLTGFTGSAGFCCVLPDIAGVFVDGRYRVQVKQQVADVFTPVDWPEVALKDWLLQQEQAFGLSGNIGFDPWLHTPKEIEALETALSQSNLSLTPVANMVDQIWQDQPAPSMEAAFVQPVDLAGEPHEAKIDRLAQSLSQAQHCAAVITLPDSLCWLLNIRGADIPRNPVMHGFAILHASGQVDLFAEASKLTQVTDHLGDKLRIFAPNKFLARLSGLSGPVRLDKASAPFAALSALIAAGIEVVFDDDICALPKARKNAVEISGATEAHLRDGAAMCSFLTWFEANATKGISEIDVVTHLERCRRDTGALRDISFETIAGTGPNGAVIHYRVTHDTDRTLQAGDLLVLDSGGQYQDGTTDITRTLPVGEVGQTERAAFTRVLKGMIAMSQLVWPKGLSGRELESVGRLPLWQAGLDFDHGLGHGVGSYLCVHEGPQRLSKASAVPFEPGMILSNEPGYYREGAFGIRIENLIYVTDAKQISGGDAHRSMLRFETLTYVPIDRNLIVPDMLTQPEQEWLNTYHQTCYERLSPRVSEDVLAWLTAATRPL